MNRRILLLSFCILMAIGLSACSEEPDFPSAPEFGYLAISNQTPHDIQVIRFRVTSPTSDVWGRNMVNEAEIEGNQALIRMPPGTYDFHFESNDAEMFWTFTEVVIAAGRDTDLTIQ